MKTFLKALYILIFCKIFTLSVFAGEARFLHLDRFNGNVAQLIATNGMQSIEQTAEVNDGIARFDIPAGQWDLSLYLPGAVPLVHRGKAVPASPLSVGIASFVNAHIGGIVSGTLLEGTYLVDSTLRVTTGASLDIEAGCMIIFDSQAGMEIHGRLQALGEPSNKVRFTSKETFSWQGIQFINADRKSTLLHVEISRTAPTAMYASASNVFLDSCRISKCFGGNALAHGVLMETGSFVSLNNTTFDGSENSSNQSAVYAIDSKLDMSHCLIINHSSVNGQAMVYVKNTSLEFSNCVMYRNSGSKSLCQILADDCGTQTINISNSIISNNSSISGMAGVELIQKPLATSVTNNVFYANTSLSSSEIAANYLFHDPKIGSFLTGSSIAVDSLGNIWQDPLFVNPSAGDFRLKAESPVISISKEVKTVDIVTGDEQNASDAVIDPNSVTQYVGVNPYILLDFYTYLSEKITFPNKAGDIILRSDDVQIIANGTAVSSEYYQVTESVKLTSNVVSSPVDQTRPSPLPVLYAGSDAEICAGDVFKLIEATAENYTLLRWSTDGDGKFNSTSAVRPTYTPGINDISKGGAILTLYAENGSPANYESNRMVISFQPKFPVFLSNKLDVCTNDEIVIEALYGETYIWSNGSKAKSITILPTEKKTYSITVSQGGCTMTDSIIVQTIQPYTGNISVSQTQDIMFLDIPSVQKDWETYDWTFDDTASASGKSCVRQFNSEGTHHACLTITDENYGCSSEVCTDFNYVLPKFSLGGQIFCGKYPAQSAISQLYRQINGRWVLVDSLVCTENAYFHFSKLPIGTYAVCGKLLGNDPNFSNFAPTFYGGSYAIDNARLVKHFQNSWKTDISLSTGTSSGLLVNDQFVIYSADGTIEVQSSKMMDGLILFSANGRQVFSISDLHGVKIASQPKNIPQGIYSVKVLFTDGTSGNVVFYAN